MRLIYMFFVLVYKILTFSLLSIFRHLRALQLYSAVHSSYLLHFKSTYNFSSLPTLCFSSFLTIIYIDSNLLDEFISCLPLHIYLMFSDLCEKEHLYEDAKLAKRFDEPSNSSFDLRTNMLKRKLLNPSREINHKVPDSQKIITYPQT